MLTCAFTGHRPSKLSYLRNADHPDYRRLSGMLGAVCLELHGEGFSRLLSGMDLGVDILAAEEKEDAQGAPGSVAHLRFALPRPSESLAGSR